LRLYYIDDSADEKLAVFSALGIAEEQWNACFQLLKGFRRSLKASDGIYVQKELHAWEFVSGRGRPAGETIITKFRRSRIFLEAMRIAASLPGARLLNAVFPKGQKARAFERLLNRVNRNAESFDTRAILIMDEGSEAEYTRLCRRMHVFNPIMSAKGTWEDTGQAVRNVPIDRILEDPFFKDSQKSYFIQLVDFCAYALLRRERPIAARCKYGIHEGFDLLRAILETRASRDPEGIIRP